MPLPAEAASTTPRNCGSTANNNSACWAGSSPTRAGKGKCVAVVGMVLLLPVVQPALRSRNNVGDGALDPGIIAALLKRVFAQAMPQRQQRNARDVGRLGGGVAFEGGQRDGGAAES